MLRVPLKFDLTLNQCCIRRIRINRIFQTIYIFSAIPWRILCVAEIESKNLSSESHFLPIVFAIVRGARYLYYFSLLFVPRALARYLLASDSGAPQFNCVTLHFDKQNLPYYIHICIYHICIFTRAVFDMQSWNISWLFSFSVGCFWFGVANILLAATRTRWCEARALYTFGAALYIRVYMFPKKGDVYVLAAETPVDFQPNHGYPRLMCGARRHTSALCGSKRRCRVVATRHHRRRRRVLHFAQLLRRTNMSWHAIYVLHAAVNGPAKDMRRGLIRRHTYMMGVWQLTVNS